MDRTSLTYLFIANCFTVSFDMLISGGLQVVKVKVGTTKTQQNHARLKRGGSDFNRPMEIQVKSNGKKRQEKSNDSGFCLTPLLPRPLIVLPDYLREIGQRHLKLFQNRKISIEAFSFVPLKPILKGNHGDQKGEL